MADNFVIYNSLTRKEEVFEPLNPPMVGLYVCGPTVYGDAHLGHARPAITFDILFRYLTHLNYKVRYVRNITDVGHLENDADEGEDKVEKKARLEQLEPMEVAQMYINRYHSAMDRLGVLRPSIEPQASGHIIEQIELVKTIINKGFGYESGGSVYFDVERYNSQIGGYGRLSGRNVEDMISGGRALDGQSDKRSSLDFALWKKAAPQHIMRWQSPWSDGFPGWHAECSAMSTKYLGKKFDIHGGGMDLLFPHHECEIAQGTAAFGKDSGAKYWVHNNMITINGQKMGKSLGNFITLDQLFSGDHPYLERGYSPMTIRFFILQAHYRSTLDFSNEALQAAEKGFLRLMKAIQTLKKITPAKESTINVEEFSKACYGAMNNDLSSPSVIANLFDWVKTINQLFDGNGAICAKDLLYLQNNMNTIVFDILGLSDESVDDSSARLDGVLKLLLELRQEAKSAGDWAKSDLIRNQLAELGVRVKDRKDGVDYEI